MTKILKVVSTLGFLILFWSLLPQSTKASDGVTYLRSTTLENHRCTAASLLMPDGNYPILVGCQDIIYPVNQAGGTFFYYVLWSTPLDGSNPIRLGELGRGRDTYKTNKDFGGMFVTIEDASNPRQPTGRVVMQGRVVDYTTLSPEFSPTITIEGEEPIITPSPIQSSSSSVISTLRRAGLAAALGIIALIVLVFVITRPR